MDNTKGNPEDLHTVGTTGTGMMTTPNWVNPGTPDAGFISEKDLQSAVVSTSGTNALRSNVIKD